MTVNGIGYKLFKTLTVFVVALFVCAAVMLWFFPGPIAKGLSSEIEYQPVPVQYFLSVAQFYGEQLHITSLLFE